MSSTAVATRARAGRHRAPEPTWLRQWSALSGRSLHTMWISGQFFIAVIAPLIFTVGFYLPLRLVMRFQGIDYAQFVMPIIVLQAMAFTAISAAHRAATEASNGMKSRFQTMPVAVGVPLGARMTACFVHSSISLVAAIGYGLVIGFRFQGGLTYTIGFCALAMLVGFTLTAGADALGTLTKSPEVTSQALTLPQLILGMFSSGFVPVEQFPSWAQGFVRNQPISQFAGAMRAMSEGAITLPVLLPSLLWCAGLAGVFIPLSIWANVRRG
ncbi:ABC transporter permease [Rhodococcus triatomae]|uniref:ABC-2 type transport system permease protein n=1 Tax=Rhodococcus triatomae TaxID=300028 RepID=A0A1G8RC92_9NOCA|nr:ABC transporter permease [Rhodococcus triatomae]QNG19639.1 ABC transporter permease [Rhodococcus triatomae]QNG24446.1 ABC transporter permease [Rhodococcus triatomae]SDJ14617.1 ABC-2 type transport system permease protein [Rhodococcus triatomae]